MSVGGLQYQDKIEFDSASGVKSICLYFGDITKQPIEEKVDLLMISAFHGELPSMNTYILG